MGNDKGNDKFFCRGCGPLANGGHTPGCYVAKRAAEKVLQATCAHTYGVTQTTGVPLGPPRCARCDLDLPANRGYQEPDGAETLGPRGRFEEEIQRARGGVSSPHLRIVREMPIDAPRNWSLTSRPPTASFRPERVFVQAPANLTADWVINDIKIGNRSTFLPVPRWRRVAHRIWRALTWWYPRRPRTGTRGKLPLRRPINGRDTPA